MSELLEQRLKRLKSYAEELDFEVSEQGEEISLMGHYIAARFPKTTKGIEKANEWLSKFEDENYE